MTKFNIPVVLFIFKRCDKAMQIIDRISEVKPQRLYLIGDGPRFKSEVEDIKQCRQVIEKKVSWDCELITNYADTNRGVYENIAGGVKWVFQREDVAIFLEDDNLPDLTFFPYCKELLTRYENNDRVLWIMGSNYLLETSFADGASYGFTQLMLPCGWASWRTKFLRYYDGELNAWRNPERRKRILEMSYSSSHKKQEIRSWESEVLAFEKNQRYNSWDYQMSLTLRYNNLLGIVPKYNLITNIGVDEFSIHGGDSYQNVMIQRFCGNKTKHLEFPLRHPRVVKIDQKNERKLGRLILYPLGLRIRIALVEFFKRTFGIDNNTSLRQALRRIIP